MHGKYQKFEINMELEKPDFRLWKKGQDEVLCFLETYKEKRSVYLSVSNLLPSHFLQNEKKQAYHVLLLGVENGQVIHQDFGSFYVNQKGEGSMFQKFTGPDLSCYTHCLLIASREDAEIEVIYRGKTPFFVEEKPAEVKRSDEWASFVTKCDEGHHIQPFTAEYDETGASWFRMEVDDALPELLNPCQQWINTYRHFLLGRKEDYYYIAIPGRFLQKEQPCRETQTFLLWQPLRGGEVYFSCPEEMTAKQQEEIFGYWIAELDLNTKALKSL